MVAGTKAYMIEIMRCPSSRVQRCGVGSHFRLRLWIQLRLQHLEAFDSNAKMIWSIEN